VWAKLWLRERVECCGNGSEGRSRSGGGESHPACGNKAMPRTAGFLWHQGDEGHLIGWQGEGAEPSPRILFLLEGRWQHGTHCAAVCQCDPLG